MSRPFSDEDVFRAVAHPTRRSILDLLRDGERTAGDIARTLRRTASVLSEHLRMLRTTGLVIQNRRGPHRFYRLNDHRLAVVQQWATECTCRKNSKASTQQSAVNLAGRIDLRSDASQAFSGLAADRHGRNLNGGAAPLDPPAVAVSPENGPRETGARDTSSRPDREPRERSPPN